MATEHQIAINRNVEESTEPRTPEAGPSAAVDTLPGPNYLGRIEARFNRVYFHALNHLRCLQKARRRPKIKKVTKRTEPNPAGAALSGRPSGVHSTQPLFFAAGGPHARAVHASHGDHRCDPAGSSGTAADTFRARAENRRNVKGVMLWF